MDPNTPRRQQPHGPRPDSPEKIAYWFFRLNGCFTFENFIVHPDVRGGQRTDADLIPLRFAHRRELLTSGQPMQDHPLFDKQQVRISVFFVEVKTGKCELNGPWTNPEKENLQRVLYALGLFPESEVPQVAADLYGNLHSSRHDIALQFTAIGRSVNSRLRDRAVPQLTWPDVLSWIHSRFLIFHEQKEDHRQWDNTAKRLYHTACRQEEMRENPDAYVAHWLRQIGVRTEDAGDAR